jgi:hypothetical protein
MTGQGSDELAAAFAPFIGLQVCGVKPSRGSFLNIEFWDRSQHPSREIGRAGEALG